jgi:DNA-binding transcriptional regulator WhiA
MLPERWQEIKQEIKQKFQLEEEYEQELDHGSQEVLEFTSPLGKLKLCFVKNPKVLDKKTSYSNRIGSGVSVEYIYDPENFGYHLEVFVWSEENDQWEKFDNQNAFN